MTLRRIPITRRSIPQSRDRLSLGHEHHIFREINTVATCGISHPQMRMGGNVSEGIPVGPPTRVHVGAGQIPIARGVKIHGLRSQLRRRHFHISVRQRGNFPV